MMGHHRPEYRRWIEAAGYGKAKDLLTYEVDIAHWDDPKINRLIAAGERNPRIRIRKVDKSKFDEEARLILNLLNEAWSNNWGYVPLTEAEIAYAGKKLKPIIFNELVRVAEIDGEPVAFMLTHPRHQRADQGPQRRAVPVQFRQAAVAAAQAAHAARSRAADGRRQEAPRDAPGEPARLHDDRIHPPRRGHANTASTHGEFGWILEDNKGMLSIAQLPGAEVNHRYRIYEKAL